MEVTQIERGPHDQLPESRDTISPVNTASEVSPIEEPAESVAKERQCVRYQRSKKREESATRATVEGG